MDTVVLVLMLLTAFNFLLKQTFLEINSGRYYHRYLRCLRRIDVAVCY